MSEVVLCPLYTCHDIPMLIHINTPHIHTQIKESLVLTIEICQKMDVSMSHGCCLNIIIP